jgi:hypothetical protein
MQYNGLGLEATSMESDQTGNATSGPQLQRSSALQSAAAALGIDPAALDSDKVIVWERWQRLRNAYEAQSHSDDLTRLRRTRSRKRRVSAIAEDLPQEVL